MSSSAIGKLPPRYSFILNPYSGEWLSRCPKCRRLTHLRKFALLLHVDSWGPLALGKTCRYCTRCELLIVHQDELEAQIAQCFNTLAPQMIGNQYVVLGTVAKNTWQAGLKGSGGTLQDVLGHVADFKHRLDVVVEGGWRASRNG